MKNSLAHPILALFALTGIVAADLPKKPPISRYSTLWNNSPFTSKPPPPEQGPEVNPLDDYSLIGVSPIGGNGYRVTLINTKQPEERIMVYSDDESSEFKILGVTRKEGDPLGTVVRLQAGSKTGTVGFDQKHLTLVAPVAKAPVPPQPGLPPGLTGQPQLQPGQRQPRPRVVPPPPTPQAAGQPAQPQQGRERPQRRGN